MPASFAACTLASVCDAISPSGLSNVPSISMTSKRILAGRVSCNDDVLEFVLLCSTILLCLPYNKKSLHENDKATDYLTRRVFPGVGMILCFHYTPLLGVLTRLCRGVAYLHL